MRQRSKTETREHMQAMRFCLLFSQNIRLGARYASVVRPGCQLIIVCIVLEYIGRNIPRKFTEASTARMYLLPEDEGPSILLP